MSTALTDADLASRLREIWSRTLLMLQPLLSGRYWFLKAGTAAVVLNLLTDLPDWKSYPERLNYWPLKALEQQTQHPFKTILIEEFANPSDPYLEGAKSHLDKRAFRITIPILGHLLGLGNLSWVVFGHLSALVFFPLSVWVFEKALQDRASALFLVLGLSATWFGHAFFRTPSWATRSPGCSCYGLCRTGGLSVS